MCPWSASTFRDHRQNRHPSSPHPNTFTQAKRLFHNGHAAMNMKFPRIFTQADQLQPHRPGCCRMPSFTFTSRHARLQELGTHARHANQKAGRRCPWPRMAMTAMAPIPRGVRSAARAPAVICCLGMPPSAFCSPVGPFSQSTDRRDQNHAEAGFKTAQKRLTPSASTVRWGAHGGGGSFEEFSDMHFASPWRCFSFLAAMFGLLLAGGCATNMAALAPPAAADSPMVGSDSPVGGF